MYQLQLLSGPFLNKESAVTWSFCTVRGVCVSGCNNSLFKQCIRSALQRIREKQMKCIFRNEFDYEEEKITL